MPVYRINGKELTGSEEAIDELKQLLADQANKRCTLHDELDQLSQKIDVTQLLGMIHDAFGKNGLLSIRKGATYTDFTIEVMVPSTGLKWYWHFRLTDGTENSKAVEYVQSAIEQLKEAISQHGEENS